MTIILFYKNITLAHYCRKGLKLLWFVRQLDGWRQTDLDILLYWPITSSLDHIRLYYLQDHTYHFFRISADVAQPEAWFGPQSPAGCSQWLLDGSDLALTNPDSTTTGICIYYFIKPIYFRLDHVIFFRSFTQVRLWLTARSRVRCYRYPLPESESHRFVCAHKTIL